MEMSQPTRNDIRKFFAHSNVLDYLVLRPLSHIAQNWEMTWDPVANFYEPEVDSFAADVNAVIELIATKPTPERYHDNEDYLAEHVVRELRWPIQKKGTFWVGEDYDCILEQGGFGDLNQSNLISASSGRVHAAFKHGQTHIDDMEECHRNMLTALMTITIYHRSIDGS